MAPLVSWARMHNRFSRRCQLPPARSNPGHSQICRTIDFYAKAGYLTIQMSPVSSFKGLIEFSSGFTPRPGISHVLFDFDGTLSLIREGWAEVMIAMFLEMLPRRN